MAQISLEVVAQLFGYVAFIRFLFALFVDGVNGGKLRPRDGECDYDWPRLEIRMKG